MTESFHANRTEDDGRSNRISEVVEQCRKRLASGESPSDEEILGAYPELLPELADELRKLRLIEGARQEAASFRNPHEADESVSIADPGADTVTHDRGPTDAPSASPTQVRYFGDYELLEEIAHGGMGVVYRARQVSLDRVVALKMILAGEFASETEIERFQSEAEAAANLEHPGIVPIYEVGEYDGRHYFSMGYVEGRGLDAIVRENPLPSRQAAGFVKTAAEAIEYAHARGVLHRDLKPSNVLINEQGQPRITDFGLAKRAERDSNLTATGQILGTPSYMPPEQALGESENVDERSDVYSLGATLYCLITGRPPFQSETPAATLLQVIEKEPIAPRQLNSEIDLDLDTICLKCLEKEANKRYASAQQLADDLGRYLRNEPIHARPPRSWERAWKACRRSPKVAALLAVVALLLISITVYAWWNAGVQAGLRDEAEEGRQQAVKERQLADRNRRLAEARQVQLQHRLAKLALENNQFEEAGRALSDLPKAVVSWDTRRLRYEASRRPRVVQRMTEGHWGFLDVVRSPDGKRLVSADAGGLLVLWDIATGTPIRRLNEVRWSAGMKMPLHHYMRTGDPPDVMKWGTCVTALAWLKDKLGAASLDGRGLLIDTKTGETKEILEADESLYCVCSSPDQKILFGGSEGHVYLGVPGANREQVSKAKISPSAVIDVAWVSPANFWLAACADGKAYVLDRETLDALETVETPASIWALDVSQDGHVVIAGQSNELGVWRTNKNIPHMVRVVSLDIPDSLDKRVDAVHTACFSIDGRSVFAVDDSGRLLRWNWKSNFIDWQVVGILKDSRLRQIRNLLEKSRPPLHLALPFQRVGAALLEIGRDRLLAAGRDCIMSIWQVPEGATQSVRTLQSKVGPKPQLVYDVNKPNILWAMDAQGMVSVIDPTNDKLLDTKQAHKGGVASLACNPQSGGVATVGGDKHVRFWELDGDKKIRPAGLEKISHPHGLLSHAISPDGEWLAAVDERGSISVWKLPDGKHEFLDRLSEHAGRPLTGRIAFNADGTKLCAFGPDQSAPIYSVDPFRRMDVQVWVAGGGGTSVAWSAVHPEVVFAGDDYPRYQVRALDPELRYLYSRLKPPRSTCVAIKSTPDNRRMVFLEKSGQFRFLDSEQLIELTRFNSSRQSVHDLAFDPKNTELALAGVDGSIEIWDTASPAPAEKLPAHDKTAWADGNLLIPPSVHPVQINDRGIAIDAEDRVCVAFVENQPGDFRKTGALYFAREGKEVQRERLEVAAEPAANRTMDATSLGLDFQANGQPRIVFRRYHAKGSPYDGDMFLARRQGRHDWHYEKVASHGNYGFYPQIVSREGRMDSIFHYDFATFSLAVTQRDNRKAPWKTRQISQQGEGLRFRYKADQEGHHHFLMGSHRYNGDRRPSMYATWDGKSLIRGEVISPSATPVYNHLALLPDGSPVVRIRRFNAEKGRDEHALLKRTDDAWSDFVQLPSLFDGFGDVTIDAKARIYLVGWKSKDRRLILWQYYDRQWTSSRIGEIEDGTPSLIHVLLDSTDQPVVIVAVSNVPYGWLRIYRQPSI